MKYSSALNPSLHVGSWEWDIQSDRVYWSEELFRIFGLDPSKGAPSYADHPEIFTSESMQRLDAAVRDCIKQGTPYEIESQIIRPNGEIRHCIGRGRAQRDENGKVFRLVGSHQDITEQKRTEDALRESEDFLNRTGDMAKVGGWEVDLNTMKVIWTRTTGRIHELPQGYFPDLEEAINYYHPEDQDHVRQCVQRAIESAEPFDFTVRLITAKGRERWVRALGQPIFDSGRCVRLSGTFQDITERLKLEEELRQSQKMEAIGTLAGGIAHEFNNVLGIIMGNAELALDDVPDWNPAKRVTQRNTKSLIQSNGSSSPDSEFCPQNHDGIEASGDQHHCQRIAQAHAGFHTGNG